MNYYKICMAFCLAVGTLGYASGIYRLVNQPSEIVDNDKNNQYLIVAATNTAASFTMTKNDKGNKTPAYKCSFKNKKGEQLFGNCEMYKLSKSNNSNKKVSLQEIRKNPSDFLLDSLPTASDKYLLKLNKVDYENLHSTEKSIKIVNAEDPKIIISTLSEVSKIKKSYDRFKTNLILVQSLKTSKAITANIKETITCSIGDQKNVKCKVYGFSTSPTINNTTVFSSANLTLLTDGNKNTLTGASKYFVIEFEEYYRNPKSWDLTSLSIEPTKIESENINSSVNYSLVGKINNENVASSELLVVNRYSRDYLIAKHKTTEKAKLATLNLLTDYHKKYDCYLGKEERSCLIYKMSESTPIQLTSFSTTNTYLKDKADFASGKYFAIEMNQSDLEKNDINTATILNINSNQNVKTGTDFGKKYGTVEVVAKVIDNDLFGFSSLFFAKTKQDPVGNKFNDLKCKFDKEKTLIPCEIYQPTNAVQSTDSLTTNLNGFTKGNLSATKPTQNDLVLIELKGKDSKRDINKLKEKTISLNSGNTELTTFDIVFAAFNSGTGSSMSPAILK